MSAPGIVFPPRNEWDIAAYPPDDVVAGYRDHRLDDPSPGSNRSPGYRWGWVNRRKDVTRVQDGYEALRSAFIQMSARPI